MKKRFLAVFLSVVLVVAVFSATVYSAETVFPVIKGVSVWRENAQKATIRFFSDSAGTVYYKVTDTPQAPEEFVSDDTTNMPASADSLCVLNLTELDGLDSGVKYVHIALVDENGICSDLLNIEMPYDLYFFDDFEGFPQDSYPSSFTRGYGGAGDAQQKITVDERENNPNNKCFRLLGAYNWASEQKVDLPDGLSGFMVMQADVKAIGGTWPLSMEFASNTGTWGTRIARMSLKSGFFGYGIGNSEMFFVDTFNFNQWYTIKIVLDLTNREIDYYADNVKINEQPIDADASALKFFSILAGNTQSGCEGYFDNVMVYNYPFREFDITSGSTEGGSISPKGTVKAIQGSSKTFTVTPDSGYHISDVFVEGESVGPVSTYTFENINGNHVIHASFAPHSFSSFAYNGNGTHTVSCACGQNYSENCVSGDWIIDTYATFCESGSKHKECIHCGGIPETENIPAVSIISAEYIRSIGIYGPNRAYLMCRKNNVSVQQLISQFDTDKLEVYRNGAKLENDDFVGTGCELRLINEQETVDRLTVVIPGDIDGDGLIKLYDVRKVLRTAVGLETLTEASTLAGDIIDDGEIKIADARKLLRVCVGLESLESNVIPR
ncbi:MAG: hypothetical protein BWY46_00317 [Firmicutes bacterium ADurb.Bin300]|nr:MAG: hypothetical protein BWY46_00317 [Firmicutes bacterium ADurb.Bin300]